jgi:hypothetical protein
MAIRFAPGTAQLRSNLSWQKRAFLRQLLGPKVEHHEWEALAAYRGLVSQAYGQRPLRPEVIADVWVRGAFRSPKGLKPFFSPARRERENSSHHYGHDIQLKRHAGLPPVGQPLPFLLEHGLKVTREAQFEKPQPWARGGYLCMGELRAQWLRETHGCPATAIGPWIHYARPILDEADIAELRQQLGPVLLVILAHSWDKMRRSMDTDQCIDAIKAMADVHNYRRVIWLRHWQDAPNLHLPANWIVACNGHRSNPWFLDALRTLLELSDGLVTNAFGTHIGYATALGKRLHWFSTPVDEDYSQLPIEETKRARAERNQRRALSEELAKILTGNEHDAQKEKQLMALLEPYWGFSQIQSPSELLKTLAIQ